MSYWTNPPPPCSPDWQCAPVPSWGANPDVVGPPLVAVGQLTFTPASQRAFELLSPTIGVPPEYQPIVEEDSTIPWWYYAAGAAVIAAGVALAFNMRWI